jgi:hypothetical protein
LTPPFLIIVERLLISYVAIYSPLTRIVARLIVKLMIKIIFQYIKKTIVIVYIVFMVKILDAASLNSGLLA